MNSVHCHIGGQAIEISTIIEGIVRTFEFAKEINEKSNSKRKCEHRWWNDNKL
jgi:hypothetical protein